MRKKRMRIPMTTLKALFLMALFLVLAALILYGTSLIAERAMEASRSDTYNIRVRVITQGEVER
jgi:hypothetical protein